MKNTKFFSAIMVLAALTACQESGQLTNDVRESTRKSTIEFANYVGAITKASKTSGNSFVAGDEMAVWGDQTTGKDYDELFKNQKVSYVSGDTWTYANKKLWNAGSEYVFYGFFPYMATDPVYEISSKDDGRLFKINSYTAPAKNTEQLDLMISERRAVSPFNTVNMIFHHMLSKVDIIFRISQEFDMTGISNIELVNFHIQGIKSTGSYVQTAWSNDDLPIGTWTTKDDLLVIEDRKNITATDNQIQHILNDYLLVPQKLSDDLFFNVSFRIHYQDGTTDLITKDNVHLANLTGKNKKDGSNVQAIKSWEPNNSYLYQLVFNPGRNDNGGNTAQPNGCITGDTDDPNHPADIDVITKDIDGDGIPDEYWIDEDRDGTPDYPLVWDDPDGDGIENLFPDKDGDGQPDGIDSDNDGNPDDLWIDTDGDGEAETEVSRKKPDAIPDPDPDGKPNGCITGDSDDPEHPTDVDIITKDTDGDGEPDEYWVDEDRDGNPDYPLVWDDPDGDGIENLYPDKDGDGKPDGTDTDGDGKPDDLWVDEDGDGEAETEVSRKKPDPIPQYTTTIEFTASVIDWEKDWESEVNISDTKE